MGFWVSELSANGTGGRKCRTVNIILDYGWYINLGYKINGLMGGFKLRKCLKSDMGLNSEILFKKFENLGESNV